MDKTVDTFPIYVGRVSNFNLHCLQPFWICVTWCQRPSNMAPDHVWLCSKLLCCSFFCLWQLMGFFFPAIILKSRWICDHLMEPWPLRHPEGLWASPVFCSSFCLQSHREVLRKQANSIPGFKDPFWNGSIMLASSFILPALTLPSDSTPSTRISPHAF